MKSTKQHKKASNERRRAEKVIERVTGLKNKPKLQAAKRTSVKPEAGSER